MDADSDGSTDSAVTQPSSPVHPISTPPTSPYGALEVSSSSLSSEPSPRKYLRREGGERVSRNTYKKRLEEEYHGETSEDEDKSENEGHSVGADYQERTTESQNNEVQADNNPPFNANIPQGADHAHPISPSGTMHEGSDSSNSSSSEDEISDTNSEQSDSSSSTVQGSSASSQNSLGSCSSDSDSDHISDSDNTSDSDDDSPLFDGSDLKTNEAILKLLQLYISERWTKTSLDKNIKLIKDMLPKPNNLPASAKTLFTQLQELTSFDGEETEHYYCCECRESVDSKGDRCRNNCESQETGVFYSFPIESQLKHMFEHRDLASIIDHHRESYVSEEDCIKDVQDGTEYKKVKMKLCGQYDVTLILDLDGVNLSSSSKQELWPILCTICEVPPKLRSAYMLVCGVFVSKKKPNMNVFLKPFVDSLNAIANRGGVPWVHPLTKLPQTSMVTAPVLCADAPAKALVLNVMQYNARYGCNSCEQKAKKVVVVDEDLEQNVRDFRRPNRRRRRRRRALQENELRVKKKRRFVFQENCARLRTGERMELQGRLAEERNKPRKGVTGTAVVSDIPHFDRASCIAAEYLHTVLLGVVKYFLNLMFFVNKGPWYIGQNIPEINKFILHEIKVPDYTKRLPRGISEMKFFKASEFRAFLLFYSLPILENYLPENYLQHWMLLVCAIQILLGEKISKDELAASEIMLRCFVREIKSLYGDRYYTYNVHCLLHLPLLVRRWGPLWATSAFDFEKFNGFISNHLHGTKHLGKEFINNMKIMLSVVVLEGTVNTPTHGFPRVLPQNNPELLGKPLDAHILNNAERLFLSNANLESATLYRRAKILCEIYTSNVYDETKKRANSIVKYYPSNANRDVEYGQILYFLKADNGNIFCLLRAYKIKHVNIFVHLESRYKLKNFIPICKADDVRESLRLCPLQSIIMKVIKVGDYICLRPNCYEVNL